MTLDRDEVALTQMTHRLHLPSLQIDGFRGFSKLRIPKFGSVNLIVGRNSVGKTSVLEAIQLYFAEGATSKLVELLRTHDEYNVRISDDEAADQSEAFAHEALFFGRPAFNAAQPEFTIGPVDSPSDCLSVRFTWLNPVVDETSQITRYIRIDTSELDQAPGALPGLWISSGKLERSLPLQRLNLFRRRFPTIEHVYRVPCVWLSPTRASSHDIRRIWDGIALTDDADHVVSTLQIILEQIEKLVLVQHPASRSERMFMARLKGYSQPVPLRSMGEGVNHLLAISLALIQAKNGVLLIDEIGNGMHFSVQDRMWDLIFQQVANTNTQVFATTHSLDCVEGFQAAANRSAGDGLVIRLQRKSGDLKAVTFEPHEVAIAERDNIEIR